MRKGPFAASIGVACLGVVALTVAAGATDVHIGISVGAPPPPAIVIAAPPSLAPIPRLPVYYAPSLPYNFFYYDGRYYTYADGAWFWSVSASGPWGYVQLGRVPQPVLAVPIAYYKAPPGHARRHGPPPRADRGRGHHKHGHERD